MTGSLLLLDEQLAPAPPKTSRLFSVWVGADIPAHYTSIEQLAQAALDLVPAGKWDGVELLLKAGEGGSWIARLLHPTWGDPHPLALNGPTTLASHIEVAKALGVRIIPYVVVRAQPAWIPSEQAMVRDCVRVAGRCVLNVEPGACVTPDTRVLTADLCWVPAGDLQVGDELVAFNEQLSGLGRALATTYRRSTVEAVGRDVQPAFRIVTSRATVIATGDHRWVGCHSRGAQRQWIRTDKLHKGDFLTCIGEPWALEMTRDGGYLAGYFDGEGCIQRSHIQHSQNEGIVLDFVQQALHDRGFDFRFRIKAGKTCRRFEMAGTYQMMRFLGQIRPRRLLAHSDRVWVNKQIRARGSDDVAVVESVTPVGLQEIVPLQTSTKTVITEGLLSHNSYYNGPNDPGFIWGYLGGMGVPASSLEVCMIPRFTQVAELGGIGCLQAWTDPALVGRASWETYGLAAPGEGVDSLRVDVAIPRLDGWGVPPGLQYRVPVCQRDERTVWAETIWAAGGMAVWHVDGN